MATRARSESRLDPTKANRPIRLPKTAFAGLRFCEGCNALSSFDGDECRMCRLRGGPIERSA